MWSEIWCQAVDASVETHLYKKFTYNTCFLKKRFIFFESNYGTHMCTQIKHHSSSINNYQGNWRWNWIFLLASMKSVFFYDSKENFIELNFQLGSFVTNICSVRNIVTVVMCFMKTITDSTHHSLMSLTKSEQINSWVNFYVLTLTIVPPEELRDFLPI